MRDNTSKIKFKRTDSNKKKFKNKWRKARGLHNKIRRKVKGHRKQPSIGYGSPVSMKNLDPSGFLPVQVSNLADLDKIKNEGKLAALISKKVGQRKKIKILEECKRMNIKVLNIKDIDKFINQVKENMDSRKKKQKRIEDKKKKSKEEALKKSEKKKDKKKTEEEIKKEVLGAERKQQKRILSEKVDKSSNIDKVRQKIVPGERP